jgi:hypothetical protein
MATTFKVLGQRLSNAGVPLDIYAPPAGNSTIVSSINICNQRGDTSSFRLAVRPANAALSGLHYLAFDTPIAANDSLTLTMGMTLATTDTVTVQANTSNVSFSLFGSELY